MRDVIIIGGGAAGLGAALYSARFSLDTMCIAKEFGGTGNIAHKVDNWIGDPGISGFDLMQRFEKHVKEYNVPLISDEVKEIKKIEGGFEVVGKETYQGKTIILAVGMKHRELGIPGEKEFAGNGVHYCYTCDGPLYKDKNIAVVGGGDSAALGALMLKDYAKKVSMLYRGEKLRAEPFNSEAVEKSENVEIITKVNVVEVLGDETGMTKVKLDNGDEMVLDGLFIEIGHIPLNELAKKLEVKLDEKGFVEVENDQSTNVEGVYVAGDLSNITGLKQFITSASQGSIAAQSAYHYIMKNK
ncbi:FAD-dependent oxidoreductase [Candidatus Woesearchaeota archaeon]|jgi:thioredoxin reductase (NADPH)|nr:FAD-dependent oxidoreductase [Candidatus Woesearchaeota archaeon]MBT3438668.1 FAD-dependent oxidoreductase [Candidatus Woesearchaeota archaeon]MBT4058592.1 FAD-dependent oxidoreductase [Candidatus Woesearchaeota archaeon]MBT4207010.1 FAD-dependent oxidoreductase [Candidatus Woesearchaeota archaeon]MBT4733311.1 FAD-dependent oxidoreductase [Candidatus Woesearchaeota archaeon]